LRLKVEEIEMEMIRRKEVIHGLHLSMGIKSAYIDNSIFNKFSEADNVKRYQKALNDMQLKVSVSRTPCKPLSASATSVCVIPHKGEYFIPKHLRTIWKRMQKTFFPQFRNGGLTSTSYSDLTKSLLEIWKDGKMSLIDNMQTEQTASISDIKSNVLLLTDFPTKPGSETAATTGVFMYICIHTHI
jgi:hypothetical protein